MPERIVHRTAEEKYHDDIGQHIDDSPEAAVRLLFWEAQQQARIADDFQRRFSYYLMGFGDGTNAFEEITTLQAIERRQGAHTMGDTPTIPVNGEDWDIDRFVRHLQETQPNVWAQLHWRIYLLVNSEEAVQANMTQWLWSWEWLLANEGRLLPGMQVTL